MSTRQYSLDKVELSWAKLDLKEGAAAGTAIQDARTSAAWSFKPTGVGGIVRVYNPDESGILTLTADPESKLHQQLWDIYELDRISRNQVFPGNMTDNSTGEVNGYVNMWIMTPPDEGRGTESATVTWQFAYEKKQKQTASGTVNLVGS